MTLSSFIGTRPPDPAGVELMFMCTTVSTDAAAMTLQISGLRMSARTNSVRPSRRSISDDGGTVSTPMTRPIDGSAASSAASAPPSHRLTPVTRMTAGGTSVSSLLVASLDARLLQQLAVLLLRHPLAALLDDRTHVVLPTSWSHGAPGAATGWSRRPAVRAPCEVISSCAARPATGAWPLGARAYLVTFWNGPAAGSQAERARPGGQRGPSSGDVGVSVAQVVVHRALGDAEG